jgi:aldehyde dehydrogenase (NAD+)
MKPSEITPLTALKLSELVKEAGFPPGVINTIPSLGPDGGAALAAHKGVDKIAFTGSTVTGRKVLAAAAESNLKKVSLELGGKSPHVIFESAKIEEAAKWAALGVLYNTGQDCTAGSRVYVQDTIYDKFVTTLAAKAQELVIGDGFDEKSGGGPVVSKAQYERVWSYIESGKKEGAKVIVGGVKRTTPGYWVDPTIFTDVRPDMKIVKEEIFGPVLAVGKFHTEQEAIDLANDTSYGLAAALHSTDQAQCHRVSSALEAGTVWVNQYCVLYNNVPFGGKKQSGIGRELGRQALDEYISTKAVHWNYGEDCEWPL